MDLDQALDFAKSRHHGVLVTSRRSGRPQLSNIGYALDGGTGAGAGDAVARISVTDSRAKTRNLRRDPAASLYVPGDSFWAYVVLDGTVELSGVTSEPGDPTSDELVALYREASGQEHPDWDEFRAVMVEERRLVVRLRPTYAYGMVT